jgi:succinate dehydrogenase/fumarate reductase cytochrome b subunit (b558 family)
MVLWGTMVGKKVVMAVTGLVLVGFVIAHMLGNLKIFLGAEAIDAYAVFLRTMGEPLFPYSLLLWVVRIVLLVCVVLHITAAVQLTRMSWAARPQGYETQQSIATTYAARTMRWSGVILVLFIIYHLLHLTAGAVGFHPGEFRHLSVYHNVVAGAAGRFVTYQVDGVTRDMSFLEMLDVLNEELTGRGEEPVAFEHDCREGICGSCGFLINGVPHGPRRHTTVCQLHMRFFKDGDSLTLEPWRARTFPVVRDLVVDRSAFDRIIQAGGYITAPTGSAPRPVPSWFRRRRRIRRSTPPRASAAAPAWRPAPTRRPCSSPRPRSRT